MPGIGSQLEDVKKEKPQVKPLPFQTLNQQDDPMLDVSHPASLLGQASPKVIGGSNLGAMPSYAEGGDVPKDQVAKVDQGERVLNPEETHAYKSAALGNAPPTALGRIADRAHEIYNEGTKFPTTSPNEEVQAIGNKMQLVDDLKAQGENPRDPATQMRPFSPAGVDKLHPYGEYGNRPGEKRLDPQGNEINPSTPEGVGAVGPKMPVPTALGRLPSYQEGGTVPEDQVANLDKGEHVLDPEKAEAYRQAEAEANQEHGAPVDFGGRVISNPKNIKPMLDTEHAPPDYKLQGAKMSIENAPLGKQHTDISNADAEPEPEIKFNGGGPMRPSEDGQASPVISLASTKAPLGTASPFSSKMKPLPSIETPVDSGTTDHPNAPQSGNKIVNAGDPAAGYPVGNAEDAKMAVVKKDQEEAMRKGDLVGLGMSKINERMLKAGQGEEPALPTPLAPTADTAHQELLSKRQDYQTRIQAALDKGTPEGREEAASLTLAAQHFDKMNPYGSEANHPGVLGKIEHGLAKAGNIAGNIVAPATMSLIPGTELNKRAQEDRARTQIGEATKEELEKAQTRVAGAKTPSEQVYMHAMRGGPDGGPQINPDTQKPYTDAEALQLSTGAGKAPLQQAMNELQKQINPDTGKKYNPEEAFAKASFDASNAKMNERQKRVADYVHAHNMEDTPANRETARIALETADTNAKAIAALPYAEQKTKFGSDLATTRALLVQQNADANQRGLKADELQNTENARYDKVINQIQLAKDALADSDTSQFAANVVPVITTLTTTSAEGVKRINKQELDRFLPAEGSLGRWASAHADKWMAGEIPTEYKEEVGKFLDKLGKSFNAEHTSNTKSIDDTVRQGAQQPVQKPEGGGASPKPEPSKPQTPAATAPAATTSGFADWKKKQETKLR